MGEWSEETLPGFDWPVSTETLPIEMADQITLTAREVLDVCDRIETAVWDIDMAIESASIDWTMFDAARHKIIRAVSELSNRLVVPK